VVKRKKEKEREGGRDRIVGIGEEEGLLMISALVAL
jgi:hypothetical protein